MGLGGEPWKAPELALPADRAPRRPGRPVAGLTPGAAGEGHPDRAAHPSPDPAPDDLTDDRPIEIEPRFCGEIHRHRCELPAADGSGEPGRLG